METLINNRQLLSQIIIKIFLLILKHFTLPNLTIHKSILYCLLAFRKIIAEFNRMKRYHLYDGYGLFHMFNNKVYPIYNFYLSMLLLIY